MNDQNVGDINSVLRYLSGQISFNDWSQSGALPLLLDGHIPSDRQDHPGIEDDEPTSDLIDEVDNASNGSEGTFQH